MKLIILLLLTFQITYESKLKQAGVMKGDHLDGRYNMIVFIILIRIYIILNLQSQCQFYGNNLNKIKKY